ncbi:MAG: hypothetical protein GXO37_05245 [Chloroflexi bacterium]|nr:hypothetical protein [Chloroflexota bacterium]
MVRLHPNLETPQPLRRCDWPACGAACCFQGVWVDEVEIQDILAHAAVIAPHMRPPDRDPTRWFQDRREPDDHALSGWVRPTRVRPDRTHYRGSRCIFLRADFKCALQVAAEAQGLHPWRWKPFYCILHPLDLDDQGRILLPPVDELLAEPAACVRAARPKIRPRDLFAEELAYLVGGAYATRRAAGPRGAGSPEEDRPAD